MSRIQPLSLIATALLAGVIAILVGAWVFRVDLANRGIEAWLTDEEIGITSLSIEELSLNHVVLRDIHLSSSANVHASSLTIQFSIPGVFDKKIDQIDATGLSVEIANEDHAPSPGETESDAWRIGGINVNDIEFSFAGAGILAGFEGGLSIPTAFDTDADPLTLLKNIKIEGTGSVALTDYVVRNSVEPGKDLKLTGQIGASAVVEPEVTKVVIDLSDGMEHTPLNEVLTLPDGLEELTNQRGKLTSDSITITLPTEALLTQALFGQSGFIRGDLNYALNDHNTLSLALDALNISQSDDSLSVNGLTGALSSVIDRPHTTIASVTSRIQLGTLSAQFDQNYSPQNIDVELAKSEISLTLAGGAKIDLAIPVSGFQYHNDGQTGIQLNDVSVSEAGIGLDAFLPLITVDGDPAGFLGGAAATALSVMVDSDPILLNGLSALCLPLVAAAEITGVLEDFEADLTVNAPLNAEQVEGARITINREEDEFGISGNTGQLSFEPGVFEPSDLSALALLAGLEVAGSTQTQFDLRYTNRNSQLGGIISTELDNIQLGYQDTGSVRFTGLAEFSAARFPATLIPIDMQGEVNLPGLEPLPATLSVSVEDEESARLHNLQLEVFGGSAAMRDVTVVLNETGAQSEGTLIVNALNLADLARILEIEEFEATGTITGALPFEIIDGEAQIGIGDLIADGKGRLKYASAELRALGESNENLGLLAQALQDFRYENLKLSVDIPRSGEGTVSMNITGSNPDVLDGYPFDVTVNLQSDYAKLAGFLVQVINSAELVIRNPLNSSASTRER